MATDLESYRKARPRSQQTELSGELQLPASLSDVSLLDQAEHMANALVNVSFDPKPPPGSENFPAEFNRLVEEIERRDLPLSVSVERCRFMFPPL